MNMRVVAVGQDPYWLAAVQRATTSWTGDPATVKCLGDLLNCLSSLPAPQANTLLLVDASGQGDLEQVVSGLRDRGWRYVIVVAADPSAKEATAVLRRNLGFDYWEKTYEEDAIRKRLKASFDEITLPLPPLPIHPDPSKE
jgi:hypothetical protein